MCRRYPQFLSGRVATYVCVQECISPVISEEGRGCRYQERHFSPYHFPSPSLSFAILRPFSVSSPLPYPSYNFYFSLFPSLSPFLLPSSSPRSSPFHSSFFPSISSPIRSPLLSPPLPTPHLYIFLDPVLPLTPPFPIFSFPLSHISPSPTPFPIPLYLHLLPFSPSLFPLLSLFPLPPPPSIPIPSPPPHSPSPLPPSR